MLAQDVRAAQAVSVCCAQHLLRRAYPNVGNAELASPTRAAGSSFARGRMLSRVVPTAHGADNHFVRGYILSHVVLITRRLIIIFYFNTCSPVFRTRSRWLFRQRAHARTGCARRTRPLCALSHYHSKGYGGLPPCLPLALDLFAPSRRNSKVFQFCTRRRQPFRQQSHTLPPRPHFLPALPHFYIPVKGAGPAPLIKNGP